MATNDKLTAATVRRDLASLRGMTAGATVLIQSIDDRLADLTSRKGWDQAALPGPCPSETVSSVLAEIGLAHGHLDLVERLLLALEHRFDPEPPVDG